VSVHGGTRWRCECGTVGVKGDQCVVCGMLSPFARLQQAAAFPLGVTLLPRRVVPKSPKPPKAGPPAQGPTPRAARQPRPSVEARREARALAREAKLLARATRTGAPPARPKPGKAQKRRAAGRPRLSPAEKRARALERLRQRYLAKYGQAARVEEPAA
jgi:hypothetical protein